MSVTVTVLSVGLPVYLPVDFLRVFCMLSFVHAAVYNTNVKAMGVLEADVAPGLQYPGQVDGELVFSYRPIVRAVSLYLCLLFLRSTPYLWAPVGLKAKTHSTVQCSSYPADSVGCCTDALRRHRLLRAV